MGIDGERTIVKAGFSNYETGKFTIMGDSIRVYDAEGKLLLDGKFDLKGNIFVFSHIDKDKNSWFISLERD